MDCRVDLKELIMAKSVARNFWGRKLTLISDSFLDLFHECFSQYRLPRERNRLLAGISPDTRYRRMTVLSAVVFVCFVAARRKWPQNDGRLKAYRDARKRSEYHFMSRARFYDIVTVRRQNTSNELKRIEALLALHFSLGAGYPTHSRVLWKCIEQALCTDGLGDPSTKNVLSIEDVDNLFASIRLNLYNQRKKRTEDDLVKEAKAIYRELRHKLNDTRLRDPRDELLISAVHRQT